MHWLLLTLASAVLLSLYTPLMKRALAHEQTDQILAIYPLIAAICVALIADVDYSIIMTETGWLLLLKAFTIALTIYCANLALERLPISIYSPLRNISPVVLLFLGWFLLGETIGPVQILGLVLIVLGAILLDVDVREKHQLKKLKKFFKQPIMLIIVLASVCISFAPIFDRLILRETDAVTSLFWYLALLAGIFWIFHISKEHKLPIMGLEKKEWPWLFLMAFVIIGSDWLYFQAIQIPGTILVVLIGVRRLSNLFSTIIGGKLFHEDHILYRGAMCLLMIVGIVLLVV